MALGESISAKEPVPNIDASTTSVVHSMRNFRSPGKSTDKKESKNSRESGFSHPIERTSSFHVPIKSTYDPNASVKYKAPRSPKKVSKAMPMQEDGSTIDKSRAISGIKTIERRTVPGTTPQERTKRDSKANANLVFGHPLDE